MSYVDLNTIHNPQASTNDAPATWGDAVRDNFEVFADGYLAHVHNSAAQAIPNTTGTALTFDSERRDNDGIHSTSSNTHRLTAARDGYYSCFCEGYLEANSTGIRALTTYLNGSEIAPGDFESSPNALVNCRLGCRFGWPLVAGDYLEWRIYQSSGGDLDATFEAGIAWVCL